MALGTGHSPAEHSRRRLLAVGWGLAALLPVLGLVLAALDYAHYRHELDVRAGIIAHAVEKQLRDRVYLIDRQLVAAAAAADGHVIAMEGLRIERATAPAAAGASLLQLGPPVRAGQRWQVPISRRVGDRIVHARIDAAIFGDVVRGYQVGARDQINLLHADGVMLARAGDSERHIGRPMAGTTLFVAPHRGRAAGQFSERSVIDGIPRRFTYRRVARLPILVVVGTEPQGAFAAWAIPAAIALAMALAIAIAWGWLVRRFSAVQASQSRLITRMRHTEDKLREAHRLARLGDYEWEVDSGRLILSEQVSDIYGFDPPRTELRVEEVFALIHPEDLTLIEALTADALQGRSPERFEFRIRRPDGATRRLLARTTLAEVAERGQVLLGVVQDITELVDARERVTAAEAQYRFLFEHNPLPMWVFDRESLAFLAVNDAMLAHYGYSREELLRTSMLGIRPAEDQAALRDAEQMPGHARPQGHVWNHLHKDGRLMRVAIFSHDIEFDGRPARLVAAQDVTEREQSEERFRLVARATSDAVYDYDIASGAIWWSENFATRFGYPHDTNAAPDIDAWAALVHPGDRACTEASLEQAIGGGATEWQEEYRLMRGDGSYAAVLERGFVLRDAQGRPVRMVGGVLDVSERQQYEAQLAHRATHDELTGLPNRQLLEDRLQQAIFNADRYGRNVALVFIDLDDFKLVNDSLGHVAGDQVLGIVATRLLGIARDTDTVARFGGDEFAVVLTEQAGEDGVRHVIDRLVESLGAPMEIAGLQHTVTASIGWCRYPEGGHDAGTLLMHGDLAMYQAKRQGRNRAVAFRSEFTANATQRLQLVSQLRQALERNEFVPVFQPLFDRDGRPVALETLVRWQHPERGLLLPGEFIGVCEESGLIVELGRHVLREACSYYPKLVAAGLGQMRIAVNVSAAQFNEDLCDHVRDAMREHGLPADVLELEITESLLMSNPERAIELMRQICALGVTFSIDDFGTGYSSLAYLKRFPIDRLKIDRSFVQDLGVDEDDAAICNSVIGLARALGIRTVAEGVETELQLDWLRERRIDEVQGYLLGRPERFEELIDRLRPRD